MSAAVSLSIKVVPGSSRDCVAGWLGDTLKVRVRAPAERGKANLAVEKIIAEAIGVSPASVCVVKGRASPRKVVEISSLSKSEVHRRLSELQTA